MSDDAVVMDLVRYLMRMDAKLDQILYVLEEDDDDEEAGPDA
jgi:hypothetical protein